jgi:hypothetical protein
LFPGGYGKGERGERKRVIRRKGGKKEMMGEEGTWETGEKKKGLRQKCGGLLKGQDTHKLSSNF